MGLAFLALEYCPIVFVSIVRRLAYRGVSSGCPFNDMIVKDVLCLRNLSMMENDNTGDKPGTLQVSETECSQGIVRSPRACGLIF